MEDDPLLPDQILSSGITDSKGRFNIPWQVQKDSLETDFDVYATFDGDSNYQYARSMNQILSVLRFGGAISLDAMPYSANVGDTIKLSGTLEFPTGSSEGAIVYIKDEDPLSADDLLATAYVNSDGRFTANWFVTEIDADGEVDIYAVFEGNDQFYRLTTCDPNPTMDYGGSCEFTIPLQVYSTQESPPQPSQTYGENQYMGLFYSLNLIDRPIVAIVPDPDAYDTTVKYVGSTQEGIQMWSSNMQARYGGDWDVEFEVIGKEQLFFSSEPDIIVNLVTPEQEAGCVSDFAGVAYISDKPVRPIQTKVCVINGGTLRSGVDVAATAAHEFIHAMGLGHTWNVEGDMMCSYDTNDAGQIVWTCPNMALGKSKTPSELNYAAVAALYGKDGYLSPNSKVTYGQKFTVGAGIGAGIEQYLMDTDNDGIMDDKDECISAAEIFNGHEDYDGCPDSVSIQPGESGDSQQSGKSDGGIVHVKSKMTQGYVDRYEVDLDSRTLKVLVNTSHKDSELAITLPRHLIDSQFSNGNDQEFVVFIDGIPASFSETNTNSQERTLVIQLPPDSSEVEIVGTEISAIQVVPEFPLVILALTSTICVVVGVTRFYRQTDSI